jgi:transcriptional regulator with XRE-family HTH domain
MGEAEQAGQAVRATREAIGMSQAELATRAGVSAGHLSRVERGAKATRIYLDHLARVLADAITEREQAAS